MPSRNSVAWNRRSRLIASADRFLYLEHLLQDLRFAIRQLVKYPGFSLTAIIVLALGVGASVSIFAFVDAALIKPLPYRDPASLVHVTESVAMFPRAEPFLSRLSRLEEIEQSLQVAGCFHRERFHAEHPRRRRIGFRHTRE